jgi:hypothetical protein
MEHLHFIATAVAAEEVPDLNAYCVILAENPDGTGRRLELHRGLEYDEQDRQLRQDTYSVTTERGATHYGGVVAWSLRDDILRLRLDAQARRVLGLDGEIVIRFENPQRDAAMLRDGIRTVLGIEASSGS